MILAQAVNVELSRGGRVESQTDLQVIVVRGKRPNHVLHAILTFFTCLLWGIVWLAIGLTEKEHRVSLMVDEYGEVYRQQLT